MTLDERFAYLAEQIQALAESVELFMHESREAREHAKAELSEHAKLIDARLDKLLRVSRLEHNE